MHDVMRLLQEAKLGSHAADLIALARPAVRIEATRRDQSDLRLGESRFGGVPDLPRDFAWPEYKDRPHAFLAQVNLSELPTAVHLGLPRSGCLTFFYEVEAMTWGYDPKDRGSAIVRYFDAPPDALVRTAPPANADPQSTFDACALSFGPSIDLPDPWDLVTERIHERMTEDERSSYSDLVSSISPSSYHHLGGHPQLIQNDMRVECQLASNGIYVGTPEGYKQGEALRPGAVDWELLLQIDTDEEGPGWMWGDVGRIYFWIRRQDLAEKRFERTWLVLQCT